MVEKTLSRRDLLALAAAVPSAVALGRPWPAFGQSPSPIVKPLPPEWCAFELPWDAELMPRGRTLELHGRSWSGGAPIRRVDVSTDGGATWERAHLRGPDKPYGWARWRLPWRSPAPGRHELLARATDRDGLVQPATVPFNDGGYQFWAVVRHPVRVR